MKRTFLLFACAAVLASCTAAPPAGQDAVSGEELREELFTTINTYVFEKDLRNARRAGLEYLERFPGAPGEDEVRLILGRADIELEYHSEAYEVLRPLLEGEAESDGRTEALLMMSEIDRANGDYYDSAVKILEGLSSGPGEAAARKARERLTDVVSLLPRQRLERLREEYAGYPGIDIVLEGCLGFAIEQSDTSAIRSIREQLESTGSVRTVPDRKVSRRVTALETPVEAPGPSARKTALGLICPLSGRFAILGEAFLRGASIAMEEAARKGLRDTELVVGDSKGNPLEAMKVAARMIEEEGVEAIAGGVLSSPTIAAAQTAQGASVVLFSPVATEAGIEDIGDYVFQALSEWDTEITALARMACRDLGLVRIAMMAADNDRSRTLERVFRSELERMGSSLVASDFYSEGSTDFLQSIERIRGADPEALFIASDAEDLILILPQLSFYEFGVQLLGTSAWNSRNLLRMAGRDMEGAVFPAVIETGGDEQALRAAAAFLGDSELEVNRFSTGGYSGVRRLLEVLALSRESGTEMRDEMQRSLENRQHRYIELFTGEGIIFNTVRDERLETFATLRAKR